MPAPVLFLDRDGTIIVDVGYPRDPNAVSFVEGAPAALAEIAALGFRLVVVSNQSGVGRGIMTEAEMRCVAARFEAMAKDFGVPLAGSFYCLHAPEERCSCRKPEPGLLREGARAVGDVDFASSFMIGDKESDVLAGKAVGARTIRFGAETEPTRADFRATSWKDVLRILKMG